MTPAGLDPTIPGSVGRCLIHWATGPCAPLANFRHAATAGRCRANADEKENSSPVEFATQALPSYPSTSPLLGKLEHPTPLEGDARTLESTTQKNLRASRCAPPIHACASIHDRPTIYNMPEQSTCPPLHKCEPRHKRPYLCD